MIRYFYIAILFLLPFLISAQGSYKARTGHVHVKSTNRIMNVEADNYQVQSNLDTQTGSISFTGLTKSFEMKSGALDRAFNSKRVSVVGYPKFSFVGKILQPQAVNWSKPGRYQIRVKGELYIGPEKRVTSANGYVTVNADGTISAESNFIMRIEEFNVDKINNLMKQRIPSGLGINFNSLGISRDINIDLNVKYRKSRR